ncbi:MAG: methyltransferase domain-containing protein [Chloroflexia bacterium]|nr:methyltransferase domain-containing protein [Chloroflexia bacterium]
MPRRKLYRERIAAPTNEAVATYLLVMPGRELYAHPERLPRITSSALFGNERPIELEIGCGSGEFLCSLAKSDQKTNFVGVDLRRKSLNAAITRASAMALDNIVFMAADARLLRPLLVADSIRTVYLHFPDPITRPRFHKRRILTNRFLDTMHHAMTATGRLSVMTDHPAYFNEMLCLVEQDNRWDKTHQERFLKGFEVGTKSRFQRIWEGYGLTTLRFEVMKKGSQR